jgi:hypothetical protein
MNIDEAIKYLRQYQSWRRGEDERTMEEAGIDPTKIGEALDAVFSYFDNLSSEIG